MRVREKISNGRRPVVIYEIIPPRIVDGTIESYSQKISSLLSQTHIDAINIPEVHAEEGRGGRSHGRDSRSIIIVVGRNQKKFALVYVYLV